MSRAGEAHALLHSIGVTVNGRDKITLVDTGLIDYVLKSMNNVVVGGLVVRRAMNPSTRVLEYTIQEFGNDVQDTDPEPETIHEALPPPAVEAENDVYRDVGFLYNNVLMGYPVSELIGLALQTILDTKHFVKEWPFRDEKDELRRFLCRVLPSFRNLETDLIRELPPGELIVVPLHSTFGDLMAEVENAMRDTYCVTERLVGTEMEGLEGVQDGESLI